MALVLFAVAAVGVASTTTFAARTAGVARALVLASRATAQVVDSLRSLPCATLASGAAATAAGTVHWTVAATPVAREVRATLTPSSSRVRHLVGEEVLLPCD